MNMNIGFIPPNYYSNNIPIHSIISSDSQINSPQNFSSKEAEAFFAIRKDLAELEGKYKNMASINATVEKLKIENSQLKRLVNEYKGLEKSAALLAEENEKLKKTLSSFSVETHSQNFTNSNNLQSFQEQQESDTYDEMINELNIENQKLTRICSSINSKLQNPKVLYQTSNIISPSDKSSKSDSEIRALRQMLIAKENEILILSSDCKDLKKEKESVGAKLLAIENENSRLKLQLHELENENSQIKLDFNQEKEKSLQDDYRQILEEKELEIADLNARQLEIIQEFEAKFMELMKENERLYSLSKDIA